MNIFFLDRSPVLAAQYQVDKHVVKMIVETAQLLCTAHRVIDGRKDGSTWILDDWRNEYFYRATHVNHPSSVWCRSSIENYIWLCDHLRALGDEYTHRYDKKHATIIKLGYYLGSPPFNLKEWDWTEPPCAMDDEFVVSKDPVENYRNYYRLGKTKLHNWKNREEPEWLHSQYLT